LHCSKIEQFLEGLVLPGSQKIANILSTQTRTENVGKKPESGMAGVEKKPLKTGR
jgi:hypothetical protein